MINYKLTTKKIGIKNAEEKLFSAYGKIRDMCIADDDLYFVHGSFVGIIQKKYVNPYIVQDLNCPSSIFYNKNNNRLYVVENGGRNIKEIDIQDLKRIKAQNYLAEPHLEYLKDILKKTPKDCETSICLKNDKLCWLSEVACRGFIYENSDVKLLFGNGKAGYSTSNNITSSMFNFPNGIACLNDALYVTDTDNDMIRFVNNNAHGVYNIPCPRKIKNIGNKLIFVSEGSVKSILNGGITNLNLYNGNNICAIDGNEKYLYIIEEV